MPNNKTLYTESFIAGEDLSSKQYYFVELKADRKVELVDAATDIPIGVLQNKPKSGEEALVMVAGRTKLVAQAAIAVGNAIGPHSNGKTVAKTIGTDTTHYTAGIALEAAAAADNIITGLISCLQPTRSA